MKKRSPHKRQKRGLVWQDFAVGSITVILVVFGIWFGSRKDADSLACKTIGAEHELTVKDDEFSAERLTLRRCDTIKIANLGDEDYEFTFGTHENILNYPGFSKQSLRPNEFFVIDAVQAGDYTFHDHLRAKASIELNIRGE